MKNSKTDCLRIAVQKQGRLNQDSMRLFENIGIKYNSQKVVFIVMQSILQWTCCLCVMMISQPL